MIATEARAFVDHVYLPDVLALATALPGRRTHRSRASANYLSFGEFPEDDAAEPDLLLPRGRIMDREPDPGRVGRPGQGRRDRRRTPGTPTTATPTALRHPYSGTTEPRVHRAAAAVHDARRHRTGTAGSRRRATRTTPMEVGPLARVLVAYVEGRDGGPRRRRAMVTSGSAWPRTRCSARSAGWSPGRSRRRSSSIGSTRWLDAISRRTSRRATWPSPTSAAGIPRRGQRTRRAGRSARARAARSATGCTIRGWRRSPSYQVVDAHDLERLAARRASVAAERSRRPSSGRRSPIPTSPVEVLRTVHSFDPCPACAVH